MSNRQRLYRTHAVILRRRDFRDADRILTVFTPNYGKLELIAKGIRKTTSRKAGHLELFSHSALMVAQGRTWDIVTEVAGVESYPNIRTDLDKIGQANYISELIDCFSESGDENQPLWDLLILTLQELDELAPTASEITSQNWSSRLLQHWFEVNLLSLAGFQPQLFQCLNCDEELEAVTNYISLVEGGVFCPNCGQGRRDLEPIEADLLKVLRFLQTRPWSAVRQVNVRPHILRQVDNLLYRYLITILERQLKSVDFLHRLQYMAQSLPAVASEITTTHAVALDESGRKARSHRTTMHIREYQQWVEAWDRARTWDRILPSHTMLHALEELGEISKLVQMIEGYRDPKDKQMSVIRDDLALELSDLQVMLFKIAYLCGIDMEDAMQRGQVKADQRFPDPASGPADQVAYWQRFQAYLESAGLTDLKPEIQEVSNRQKIDPSLSE